MSRLLCGAAAAALASATVAPASASAPVEANNNIITHSSSPYFADEPGTKRYVAMTLFDMSDPSTGAGTLKTVAGVVQKHDANPLFTQDKAWEWNINNGYTSVIYDVDVSRGGTAEQTGKFKVFYSAGDDAFGGKIPGESSGSATLFANSTDGIKFEKPELGRFDYKGDKGANNVLWAGTTSVGIYDDGHNAKGNVSQRFKAWGNLPGLGNKEERKSAERLGYTAQLAGSAVSADALTWTDYRRLQNTSNSKDVKHTWRFDAQAAFYYDDKRAKYVGLNRAFRPCDDCGECPIWWQPSGGCQGHFNKHTCNAQQCNNTVRAIGVAESSSPDSDKKSGFSDLDWSPNRQVLAIKNPERQFYSAVAWPYYNMYIGIAMRFDAHDKPDTWGEGKVHCELVYSMDNDFEKGGGFQRLVSDDESDANGDSDAIDLIPHGEHGAGPDTPDGIDSASSTNAYDSHICFAAAHPVNLKHVENENNVRIYYMAGNGPHYSPAPPNPMHRNSSLALATLRPDGFLALTAKSGVFGHAYANSKLAKDEMRIEGDQFIITADAQTSGDDGLTSARVILKLAPTENRENVNPDDLPMLCAVGIIDKNVTDHPGEYYERTRGLGNGCGEKLLKQHMGARVIVQVKLTQKARLYTVGWRNTSSLWPMNATATATTDSDGAAQEQHVVDDTILYA